MPTSPPPFSLPRAPAYLVALSGGADSALLLELTVRALRAPPSQKIPLAAAHLHHGIRGEEADRDEAFCRELCQRLEIPLIVERMDIPALAAQTGESLETAARRARYDFFLRIMTQDCQAGRPVPLLLTAHHADDNLETLLDRLLRGSGTKGMGGIPPSRPLGTCPDGTPLQVARPLLEWTKADILKACEEWGLAYVTDSTNAETDYTRNRLRHTVVPLLEEQAGQGVPQRAALRLSRAAREDEDCLTGLAADLFRRHLSPDGDGLSASGLQNTHPALAKRMMALLYQRVTDGIPHRHEDGSLSATHLDGLWELVRKATPESTLSLPHDLEARLRGDWLTVRPVETPSAPMAPTPLPLGTTRWNETVTLTVEKSPIPLAPLSGETTSDSGETTSDSGGAISDSGGAVFASAVFPPTLPLPLLLRPREPGDVIRSHGMNKKLKKVLCDKNIPPHLRNILPLVCLPDGTPLWFPAAAFRDGYPAPLEGPCLRITVYCQKNKKKDV